MILDLAPPRRVAVDDTTPTPIVIVGHVDHGKSTLIGRLLHDSGSLPEGRLEAARASSQKRGLEIEWSFLLDSLQAERDQGVTIDATRLPFQVDGRPFVIIDAPGHRQFLRNMVTGAAGAAAAVLVIDVAEGARDQTRRHAMLLRLIGVRHVIVLMNKADLLDYDEAAIEAAAGAVGTLLASLGLHASALIPASARHGDNVAARSTNLGWYSGPTLMEALAAVPMLASQADRAFRLPVQDVYRDGDVRTIVGRVEAGRIAVGDEVLVGIAETRARVAAIVGWQTGVRSHSVAGESTAIVLEPDVVIERGDMIFRPGERPIRASRVRARLFWLRAEALRLGEAFRLRLATAEYAVTVSAIENVVEIDELSERTTHEVPPDGFAEIVLAAPQGILFDVFEPGGRGGRGVLVDAYGRIVGGVPLLGAAEIDGTHAIHPVDSAVTPLDRARARGHAGGVFWMTGLPGAGKSTLARATESLLFSRGSDVVVLDGDTLRSRLNSDLGFSDEDRTENIRRTASVARLMSDAGLVVLVALISPLASQRAMAGAIVGETFREVFVAAGADVCEARDPKGHYAAARAGKLPGFTGIDGGYEVPTDPAFRVETASRPVAACAEALALFVEAVTAVSEPGVQRRSR